MRDAIVVSAWTWESTNVPERLARVLAQAGARVLYAETPASLLRTGRPAVEIAPNIYRFQPRFLAHRVYEMPPLSKPQALFVTRQIIHEAKRRELKDPVFFFPHGSEPFKVAEQMKAAHFNLVHVLMDYELPQSLPHATIADVVLVIPDPAFDHLRARFGEKVYRLRQLGMPAASGVAASQAGPEDSLPFPRLLYLGAVQERLDRVVLTDLLRAHPEWNLISFGDGKIDAPNHYALPWVSPDRLRNFFKPGTIGFLPYRLDDLKNLHCVPLKLFDFFNAGMPVVATPISYLEKHPDLVYVGRGVSGLSDAIRQALAEPGTSPLRERRKAFARAHFPEHGAAYLAPLLQETQTFPPREWSAMAAAQEPF